MPSGRAADWIDLGELPPVDLHVTCLAFAESRSRDDPPAVLWARTTEPHLCIGAGQSATAEVDLDRCHARGVSVARRCLGGGTVLVDPHQWCFFLIAPSREPGTGRGDLQRIALDAAARTYLEFGIQCQPVPPGDLWIGRRKVLGSGGATVGCSHVLGASFLIDFDRELFAELVKVPSESFRNWLRDELTTGMTCWSEHGVRPRAAELARAFRRNLAAETGWRLETRKPQVFDAALGDAREELVLDDGAGSGRRRVPAGIKVNQRRYIVEHGPVRAVLEHRRVTRLALEDEEIGIDIRLCQRALASRLSGTRFQEQAPALWRALSRAAYGIVEVVA